MRLGGSLAGCKTASYTARFWASKVPGKSCEWSCAEPTAKSTSSSNTTSKSGWPCRQCSAVCALHDHQPERRWRHLDTCQYRTILHARPPRSDCSEHGPRVVRLPWAEASSRFTALFEALAISWLKEASQQGIAELLALSWDEIHGILERAVQRGLERRAAEPIPYLGVDEKSFRKRHRYLTVVNDLNRSRVLFVAEGRRQASLDGFWKTLSAEQLARVEAVAMDMWDPYVASTREHLDESEKKIVYDKYHIAAHLAKAVDQVRRAENKRLRTAERN